MSKSMYRTVVGKSVTPITVDDDVPKPYRRTVPLPPAPQVQGSESSEPHEGESPIVED